MTIARSSILCCPAIVQIGGQTFYSAGDIKLTPVPETFTPTTAMYGPGVPKLKGVSFKISFQPKGKWTTAMLAVLYPYASAVTGQSVYGSTDTPCVIHPVDGAEKITFSCAAITKSPDNQFAPDSELFKEVEIECILKNSGDVSAVDAFYTLADASFTDTSYSESDNITVPYTVSLASVGAPWDAISTEGGVSVSYKLTLNPKMVSGLGMVDRRFASQEVEITFKPVGMTVANVLSRLKLQGSGVAIGQQMSAGAANIVISGGSTKPQAVFNNAVLIDAGFLYGEPLRHDALKFVVTRPTGGAFYSLGLAA